MGVEFACKVALVFGGTGGIGTEICKKLALSGWSLVVVTRQDRKDQNLQLPKINESDIKYVTFDLSRPITPEFLETLDAVCGSNFGMMVYAAGIGSEDSFTNLSATQISEMMQINIGNLVITNNWALNRLRKTDESYIVNVGSIAAAINSSLYACTKSFIEDFHEMLHFQQSKSSQTKIMLLRPGHTKTNFHAKFERKEKPRPDILWKNPDFVAKIALRDLYRGKHISTPGSTAKLLFILTHSAPKYLKTKFTQNQV